MERGDGLPRQIRRRNLGLRKIRAQELVAARSIEIIPGPGQRPQSWKSGDATEFPGVVLAVRSHREGRGHRDCVPLSAKTIFTTEDTGEHRKAKPVTSFAEN